MKPGTNVLVCFFLVIMFLLAGCNIPQNTGAAQTQTMSGQNQ